MNHTEAFLLALLDGAGGHVEGRTRLVKLAFLAQQAGDTEPFEFESREYGPFSPEIVRTLGDLESKGLVAQTSESLPEGTKYNYRLTEDGRVAVDGLRGVTVPRKTGETYGTLPISRLLEIVYNRHPEYTSESII